MGASVSLGFVPVAEIFVGGVQWLVRKPFPRAFQWYQGRVTSAVGLRLGVLWVGLCACCASVGWATNGSLESPF
eukprot:scaffold3013_cov113-Isochrysis_galbana.AAC.2